MTTLTQDLLREIFYYDKEEGGLRFKSKPPNCQENRRWNTRYASKLCGSANNRGYLHVKLFKKKFKVHRLVFLFHKGFMPEFIDHIDGDKLNNRIENLRAVTKGENNQNAKIASSNTSGAKGVSWHKQHRKWYATLRCDKKVYFLGLYTDFEEAVQVVKGARERLHGDYHNHG